MTGSIFGEVTSFWREAAGLGIEVAIVGALAGRGLADALRRAVGSTRLGQMSPDAAGPAVGELISVEESRGVIGLTAKITDAGAIRKVIEKVYKGLQIEISMFGDQIREIILVDRPLGKSSSPAVQKIGVLYQRNTEMGIQKLRDARQTLARASSALDRAEARLNEPSAAEIEAVWTKMSPDQRTLMEIIASHRQAIGERQLFPWLIVRAAAGGGNR
ncbi:MAG TPA: hypothetical protein VGF34_04755 [Stellaceae bacterium]|jgi:hypothetical protein